MGSRKRRPRLSDVALATGGEVVSAVDEGERARIDSGPDVELQALPDLPAQEVEAKTSVSVDGPEALVMEASAGVVAASEASAAVAEELGEATMQTVHEATDRLESFASNESAFDPLTSSTDFEHKLGAEYGQASDIFSAFNARALEAWRANAEAVLSHWRTLSGVRTMSEAISLNSEFARTQIENLTAQSRDFAEIAGRLGRNVK